MNLRTFLPPASRATSSPPEVGEQAPELPTEATGRGLPRVVAFLRHTGCPFAEATMRNLRDTADRDPEVQFVAISHSPEEATEAWCEAVGGRGRVELVVDEERAGTFAVEPGGTVRWRHVPEHAGDLPDLDAAAGAARG